MSRFGRMEFVVDWWKGDKLAFKGGFRKIGTARTFAASKGAKLNSITAHQKYLGR